MNKVIIDKNLFNIDLPLAEGLISGLKRLSQRNFIISLNEGCLIENEVLNKILALENICLETDSEKADGQTYYISTERMKNNIDSILVKENSETDNFGKAAAEIIKKLRSSSLNRNTKETKISIEVFLDGEGKANIKTGIGFFDHMLEQIARHANLDMNISVKGDLHVDEHHTVEDVGITLGTALNEALGDKRGIKRYGYFLPMDESIAKCALDLGGRSFLNFKCKFERETVGEFPTELTEEFFRGLSSGLKANIFLRAKGRNDHHKIEALFKAFAKSFNEACRIDERTENNLPSTKGVL